MTIQQPPAVVGTRVGPAILKAEPEDFRVAEVAAVPPSTGAAVYTYVTVTKSGLSTFDLAERLAVALELPRESVDWLGLKDEDGITTQVLSIARILTVPQLAEWQPALDRTAHPHWARMDGIVGYGLQALTRRTLIGNTFDIALRGLSRSEADGIAAILAESKNLPFVNYYDSQRFGVIGSDVLNTHEIGAAVERGDFASAYEGFLASGNGESAKAALRTAYADTGDHATAMLTIDRRLVQFMVDAAASYRWNAALSTELAGSGPVEEVDAIASFPPLAFCDIADRRLPVVTSAPGGRVIDPDGGGWTVEPEPFRRQSVQNAYLMSSDVDDPDRVRLSFYLPRGCYATMFVRYVLWLAAQR